MDATLSAIRWIGALFRKAMGEKKTFEVTIEVSVREEKDRSEFFVEELHQCPVMARQDSEELVAFRCYPGGIIACK